MFRGIFRKRKTANKKIEVYMRKIGEIILRKRESISFFISLYV